MNKLSTIAIGFSLIALAACTSQSPEPDTDAGNAQSSESNVQETRNVMYSGTIREGGVGIFMQGTHTLELADGRFILLESSAVNLDDYLDTKAEVYGAIRPTVEAGGQIMRVERVTSLEPVESLSSSSSSSESSVPEAAASSVAVSSQVAAQSSSRVPVVQTSSVAVVTSSASSVPSTNDGQADARASLMARDNMAEANWTQQYCSSHIGFCVPVHKNWWFTSFGTTTSMLWHMEIAPSEIVNLGDGPLAVNLISGDLSGHIDGEVVTEGGTTVGYRSWTNGRHFEIRGPAILENAIRHITENLKAS